MNPYHNNDLQVPAFTPEGYVVTNSVGDSILLSPGGDYSGMEFSSIDLSFLTLQADFSKTSFRHCLFNMTDFSRSNFQLAEFHDCLIMSSAFMWTFSPCLTTTSTIFSKVRLTYSILTDAQFEGDFSEVYFANSDLKGASFRDSKISECYFLEANCHEMGISETAMDNLEIDKCDLRLMKISDCTAEHITISDSDLSGGTWESVKSLAGQWVFKNVQMTATRFSMCHAEDSTWRHCILTGAVMERCNWFLGEIDDCEFHLSTFISVGWNDSTFTNVVFQDIDAKCLRFRLSKFKNCLMLDSVIADSAWEFSEFRYIETDNVSIINPACSPNAQWPEGFVVSTDPKATSQDSPNPNGIETN